MRIFSSELAYNFSTYTFGYANYGELEEGDSLALVYNAGFLPYSGTVGVKGIFYFTRSARVLLPQFELTSENRRIAKKFDGQFEKKRTPIAEFNITEEFLAFCLDYFAKRHGENIMPRERLELILSYGIISTIISYHQEGKVVGYVFEVEGDGMAHYWYSMYDLSLTKQSLGLWLMLDCVRDAKARGLAHYYLGTVYGQKALYKTNFEPLEWFDGEHWRTDVATLRERGRSDNARVIAQMDEWKEKGKLF